MAQKKKVNIRKEARKPEEMKKANIEHAEKEKNKTETIQTNLKNNETYNIASTKGENASLLGFQGGEEYVPSGRGGRG